MNKLSLLAKTCFLLGFIGVIGSIILSFIDGKDFTWQFITLLWMGSSFVNELRIKQLEDKK
jgi:hypothetical protein